MPTGFQLHQVMGEHLGEQRQLAEHDMPLSVHEAAVERRVISPLQESELPALGLEPDSPAVRGESGSAVASSPAGDATRATDPPDQLPVLCGHGLASSAEPAECGITEE